MPNTRKVIIHKVPRDVLAAAMEQGVGLDLIISAGILLGEYEVREVTQTKKEARAIVTSQHGDVSPPGGPSCPRSQ